MSDNIVFPLLALTAKRLRLSRDEVGEISEAALHAAGIGMDEQEAIRMGIIETLRRRGAYRGRLRQAIENGEIFQMTEGGNGANGRPKRAGSPRRRRSSAAADVSTV